MSKKNYLLVAIAFAVLTISCTDSPPSAPPSTQEAAGDPSPLKGVQEANGSTEFSIDDISGHSTANGTLVFGQHDLAVGGWAIDQAANQQAGGVYVTLDGVYIEAQYGIPREDVAQSLGHAGYTNTGFSAVLPAGKLSKGPHQIGLVVLSADKTKYYNIPPSRMVNIVIQ